MVYVEYDLIDASGCEKYFESIAEMADWMRSLGEEMFVSITMTDGKENVLHSFMDIYQAYVINEDLHGGDIDCIHDKVVFPLGGGVKCKDCSGWFCY